MVYLAAQERKQQGKEVIFTSVGNPHALGQVEILNYDLGFRGSIISVFSWHEWFG